MNLRAIANSATSSINPNIAGSVKISSGWTQNPDYSRTPAFQQFDGISMQVQALSGPELRQLDGLNLQSIPRAVHMNGNIEGLDRLAGKGGDLLLFAGKTWLVVAVMEAWDQSGWCRVAVTEQVEG